MSPIVIIPNLQVDDCGEDIFPPQITTSEYSFPACFNERADVRAFFATNTRVQDECRGAVPLDPITNAAIVSACEQSTVTLTATDACGNTAVNAVMFPFDNVKPTIVVNTAAIPDVCFTSQAVAENAILQATTVTDDCTTNANNIAVSISSFAKKCDKSVATIKAVDLCENVQTRACVHIYICMIQATTSPTFIFSFYFALTSIIMSPLSRHFQSQVRRRAAQDHDRHGRHQCRLPY